jgi:hypothetical protein
LALIPVSYAYLCPMDSPITKIPCEIISPQDPSKNSNCTAGNYNYSITDLNTTLVVETGAMTNKFADVWNISFNQNVSGHEYMVAICDGSTQNFNVIINDDSRWLYIIFFLVIIILYILGRILDDNWFVIGSGFITLVFSTYMFINGLFDFNNEILNWAIFLILFGIGSHFLLSYGIEELKK